MRRARETSTLSKASHASSPFRVEIALLLLVILFVASQWLGMSIYFRFGNGLVDELRADGESAYSSYMLYSFLCLIVPPLTGLIFCAIAYTRELRSRTGFHGFFWILLTASGLLFFLYGFHMFRWIQDSFAREMAWAGQTTPFLPDIYNTALAGTVLWILAGTLLTTSPILKSLFWFRRKKEQKKSFHPQ